MNDNLDQLEQNIDTAINPQAPVGGILAQEHNDLLKAFLKAQGRFTGFSFDVGNRTEFDVGKASITGTTTSLGDDIFIEIAKSTTDFIDFSSLYNSLREGDFIKVKDRNGRVLIGKLDNKQSLTDPLNQTYFRLECILVSTNTTYTYNANDNINCFIEVIKASENNRIITNNIGANYVLTDVLHFSKMIYTKTTGNTTITLTSNQSNIKDGFLSFHVNKGGGLVEVNYDDSLIEVIGHDPNNDPVLSVKPLVDDSSKGGVQIDYIGFNSNTNKMEYHVYGALL